MKESMSSKLLDILTSGCDERVFIREHSDTNRYHLHPLKFDGLLQRGSCTCNTLTQDGLQTAMAFMNEIGRRNFQDVVANQTRRLQSLLKCFSLDEFEVIYTPSGSDAMYVQKGFYLLIWVKRSAILPSPV